MECENCGLVAQDFSHGKCPFCDADYTPITPIVYVAKEPSKEKALELRDGLSRLASWMTENPLSKMSPEYLEVERTIYLLCAEKAEEMDEIANGTR